MNAPQATEDEARFDVVVRMPAGRRLEDVAKLADAAGIRPDHVETVMKALRNGPAAKIGAAVNRQRAEKARDQFTRAGLSVELTPVLSLSAVTTGAFDNLFTCPNCGQRVTLPENRQCPNCTVFVDKVTDEMILRRKLREKERAALDFRTARDQQHAEKSAKESLEAQIRAEIRKELEAEYGIKGGGGGGVRKGVVAAAVLALAAAAFVGGRGTSAGWTMAGLFGSGNANSQAAKAGKMLDKLDAGAAAGGSTAAAAAAYGGPATGDPDVDDPLVQAAGGKRVGAKGISVEQAVAAAQTLAKSVGYKTAGTDGAAAGGNPAPTGSADGTAAAGGAPAAAGAAPAASFSPRVRTLLAFDLTRLLAELGQLPRSREMLKALRAIPAHAADAALSTAAGVADAEVRAWTLASTAPGALRPAAERLISDAQAIADPFWRTKALMQAGVIAARQPHLPPELARLFLNKSAEGLKTIQGPQQAAAMGDWTVALGEVLLAEATARAKVGQWTQARTIGAQLEAMIAQAPDASAGARLHAIDYQLKSLTGEADKAAGALAAGLALAAREPDLAERAALLRAMAALAGGTADGAMATAIESVKTAALPKNGYERARAMTMLALLHADAGMRARAGEYTQLALSTPQLDAAEAMELHADLLLRGDMVTAKSLHGAGLYADAEAMLRRLGELLL
ncbi:hypothetical protein FN976_25815 [Caenimonas sedimenti]|uniref:Uncharacterized protein n=1 Tax=Caenimonas sedimenti TaxID=2596921 RepID=A0A562ZG53_9BURK|nr:hypothetical protein [Caenimonas sedimenti]TWO66955.1 hypothetical protein FN976_25815 [Caenimonas sedimenti]